jgi:hypothetical protein
LHHEAVIAVAVAPAAVVATGMRAEDEAGEEDDGDDEDDAGHDADPGCHRGEAAVTRRLDDGGCWGRGFGGGHGAGRGFGGRRCFTHETDDASDADVRALNSI